MKVDDGAGTVVEFIYDALGRRVEKSVAVGGGAPAITRYVNEGWRTIEERDGANQVVSRYVYGNGIDEPVEIEKRDPTSGDLKQFIPMQDTNGSVLALSDSSGNLVERVKYSTYGRPTFMYDHEPPKVDQARLVGGALRIRFSEPVDQASAQEAIKLKQGETGLGGTIAFGEDDRLAMFTPSSAFPQGQVLTVLVATTLKDRSDNSLAEDFAKTFSTAGADLLIFDRVPPQIQRIKLVSGVISVEVDEEIDPASIANGLELLDGQIPVSSAIALDGEKTLTLAPSSSLTVRTHYLLKVKTSVADLSGKTLAEEHAQPFVQTGHDQILYERPAENEHATSYVGNTITFQARDYDHGTGLIFSRNRYLHPELGRFLQPDPLGYEDSANLYQAFGDNPANFSDPTGQKIVLDKRWFKDQRDYLQFKQAVEKMLRYLYLGSTLARKHIRDIMTSQTFDVYLVPGEFQFWRSSGAYVRGVGELPVAVADYKSTVGWHGITVDPTGGLRPTTKFYSLIKGKTAAGIPTFQWSSSPDEELPEDTVQSPAMGLIHELIHATFLMTSPAEYDLYQDILRRHYGNLLEERITNEETRIGIEIGEPVRFGHGGIPFTVKDPTSHSLSLEFGIWEEFSAATASSQDSIAVEIENLLKMIVEIK